jgi:hypothetical protein
MIARHDHDPRTITTRGTITTPHREQQRGDAPAFANRCKITRVAPHSA